MKKLIWIIIVILVIGGLYLVLRPEGKTGTHNLPTDSPKSFQPDPSNATFDIDGQEVTLSEGRAQFNFVPGSALVSEVTLTDKIAYGDLNNDGKTDAGVILLQSGGASGLFVNAGAYISGNINYEGTNTIFIGDRIEPTSITVNNGVLRIEYLGRTEGEPFSAEPTVPMTKELIYRSGELRER